MENSFLKDAINRIVELATPFTLETRDGRQFCSANLREVKPEVPSPVRYSVDTLEALVKLIRTEGINHSPLLYVRVDSSRRVMVDSTYTGRDYAIYSRLPLYEADGGAWKLEAKRNIAAYLGEKLADLIERGSVVVMI